MNNHILAEARIEKMHKKTEIRPKFVYAFAAIQNPKHMPEVKFSVSQHISAEARIENTRYRTEIHRKFVPALDEIQNLKQRIKI